MANCPFCGAEPQEEELRPIEAYRGIIDWCCGTSYYGEDQGYGSRGEQCYEAQIARQRELLRRCEKVVRIVKEWDDSCALIGSGNAWSRDLGRRLSQCNRTLLPDLERALEEK
jgi:hypothetical protein